VLKNVRVTAYKPENWKIDINPDLIPTLTPGEEKQVEITMIPYEEALIGDYAVTSWWMEKRHKRI